MCHMSHVMCHVSHVTCQMSYVMCHVSHVMCHMSCVTCHMSDLYIFFGHFFGASQWRVCYQRGLPRFVLPMPDFLINPPPAP